MNLIVHPIRSMVTTKTSLWSGNKTQSGTLTLSDDVRNYDYLIIVTQTNIDVFADIVAVGYASSYVLQHSAGSGNGDGFPQYRSAFNFSFSDYTHLAISSVFYNNSNWQLGIREVIGVKNATQPPPAEYEPPNSAYTLLGLSSSDTYTVAKLGRVFVFGGNNGTNVYFKNTYFTTERQINCPSNKMIIIPVVKGDKVWYGGGPYSWAYYAPCV